jgi:probable HAF family extracellular repeat protein
VSIHVLLCRLNLLLIVVALLLAGLSPAQTVSYKVTPIGSPFNPPGPISANDINRWGAIAAADRQNGRPRMGFVWRHGIGTPVPTFGGTCSSANGLSDSGHVVGSACLVGDSTFHAFLYRNRHLIDMHTFGDVNSSAGHVNRNDQVVGGFVQNGSVHSFFWEKKKAVDLGFLGGSETFGFGLNDSGVVTGQSDISNDIDPVFGIPRFHAFTWLGGVMTDLGSIFGGNFSYASGINASGQIVGSADLVDDFGAHAYLWDNGAVTDLSPFGNDITSWGNDINGHGDVVGSWGFTDTDPADGPPLDVIVCPCYAVLWQNGQPIFLNSVVDPQWNLSLGLWINDRGEIVARGQFNGGALQTVLLKPLAGTRSDRAEPVGAKTVRGITGTSPKGFRRERDGRITVISALTSGR